MSLSKQEFEDWEKKFNAETEKIIGSAEYHRPLKLFLMFSTQLEAKKALELITKYREQDSRFYRMTSFNQDTNRNVGIEIDFDKSSKHTQDDMITFFKEHGLKVRIDDGPYETHTTSN